VEFRADKTSLVHVPVGKLSFEPQKLIDKRHDGDWGDCAQQAFGGQGQIHQERDAELDDGPGVPLDSAVRTRQASTEKQWTVNSGQ